MIKFEQIGVWGIKHAIRCMRNPLNSWGRSDTVFDGDKMCLGENDVDLFLPSSFNQKRTVTMTYENLLNMLEYRRGHKLDEWRMFCDWILTLPYGSLLKEGVGNEQS